ncbi:tripartite motif-containing protein 16 [Salminus brasiliensis]|uniref:tripartite motif-containing protein 16 n=1 Tax=Salminus brasiliensis TaxID=930266 RepID=UPI003B8328BE
MRSQENQTRAEEPPAEMRSVKEEPEIQKVIQEEPQKTGEAGEKEEQLPALPPGEDDVVCDSCIESPRRAKKSCLTCLVSYCEAHLRPHLENPKFQTHRLVEPLKDVERRMCETHDSPLELYCCVDACCVCQECASGGHQGHDLLPITQARQNVEKELQNKHTEVAQTVTAAENSINKLQSSISAVEDIRAVLQQQFSVLQAAVEQVRAELSEALEGKQQNALAQAQSVRQHLEQCCSELKKTHTHLEKLVKNKNDVDFLQEYSQWRKSSRDVCVPAVCTSLTDHLQSFNSIITHTTQELCDSVLTSYRNTLKQACTTGDAPVQPTGQDISAVKQSITLPEPKTREDFLKYATPLSFDSGTAHQFLRLTEDGRKVTNTTPWQHGYPERPERFLHWKQVLASNSFYQGRHYFEVDISGEGVHVGVTSSNIARQSAENDGCLTGHVTSWCLQCNGRGFSAWNDGQETPISAPKSTRLGVYLDFAQGSLAFYAVDGGMTLLHRYRATLKEPLYPACWVPKKENVVLLVEPGQEMPLKSPSPPCSPP